MPIPGVTIEEICDAFADSYDQNELSFMVRTKLGIRLDTIVGPGTLMKVIFDLVIWSEQRGKTTALIQAGYRGNPTNPTMQTLYQKYGMATDVSLQEGGKNETALKETTTGLEKTIKDRLPQLNFSIWRTKMTQVEGQVCRIEIEGNPVGTGFLVGPDAVLTNYHVLEDVLTGGTDSANVTCRFDYKVLADKSKLEGIVVGLHPTDWNLDNCPFSPAEKTKNPDSTLPTVDQLDYSLVRISRRIGEETFAPKGGAESQSRGWLKLPTGPLLFNKDMPLMIAQYPDGSPLKLTLDTESVIGEAANGLRVRYRTNTEPGSSGSPVFDLNWNPVALHHLGDPSSDLPPTYNQGIPTDKIRARLLKTAKAELAINA